MLLLAALAHPCAAGVLARVQAAGVLRCGVVTEPADEGQDDTHGDLSPLARDFCRAVAASVLGSPRLALSAYPTEILGLAAVAAGRLDVLYGVTPGRVRMPGVAYGAPVFLDGQGFLARAGIASWKDLAHRTVCVIGGTPAEARLIAASHEAGLAIDIDPFSEVGEMEAALATGQCAAESRDVSALAAAPAKFHALARAFHLLPERLTLDPYAPAMPNDAEWVRVVDGVARAHCGRLANAAIASRSPPHRAAPAPPRG